MVKEIHLCASEANLLRDYGFRGMRACSDTLLPSYNGTKPLLSNWTLVGLLGGGKSETLNRACVTF